jgi:hypothetical protein
MGGACNSALKGEKMERKLDALIKFLDTGLQPFCWAAIIFAILYFSTILLVP